MPLALKNANAGCEDAGVVVDVGPAASFDGITATGSAGLLDNIWITDGSEAHTPGEHSLASTVDFSYGFDNGNGTFYFERTARRGNPLGGTDQVGLRRLRGVRLGRRDEQWFERRQRTHASVNGTKVGSDLTLDSTAAVN